MKRPLTLAIFTFISTASWAEEPARPALKSGLNIDFGHWALAMILVFAAIAGFAWLMRRLGNFSQLQPGKFKVLAALSLGARERVVLLQAGDKQLVLGVAPGRVQTLCILEGEEVIRCETPAAAEPSFAARMEELIGRKPS